MAEQTKRGRGRPKGSNGKSLILVSIKDLIEALGENGSVKVSRKFLLELGIQVEDNGLKSITESTLSKEEEKKVAVDVKVI